MNYIKICKNLEIPQAVVNINNFFATTIITNSSTEQISINIKEPFDVEIINTEEINFLEKIDIDENIPFDKIKDNLLKSNLKNISLDHCNKEEKDAIRKLCYEYRDIFYSKEIPLTFTNQVKHKINTTDENPIFVKSYRYPEVHRQEVKDQIKEMLDNGIIKNSTSPWSSPIWIVPKKMDQSGRRKWRLVIDYRKLNEKTVNDKYPLPNITEILDKLGKSQYFTTLDLASGYHQIEMDKDDMPKTAFTTENGHYEFKRMPFGLKNAPSTL